MPVSYDEMLTKKKSVSTTPTSATSAWDAMKDPSADKAVVRAQLSMPKANPIIGKTVTAADLKKLAPIATTSQKTNSGDGLSASPDKKEPFFEKLGRYLGNSSDSTLPLAPINSNPETQKAAEYVAGKAVSGAIGTAKGFVNELGHLGQGAARGAYAREAARLKTQDAVKGTTSPLTTQMQKTSAELSAQPLKSYVNFGQNYDKKLNEFEVENRFDQDKGLQTFGDVAQGVGGMVPAIVSNFIVPGSSLFVMATGAAGNATEEATKRGADTGSALAYGATVGITEAVTEKLLNGVAGIFGKGAADDVTKALVKRVSKDETTQKAVMALANVLGEGFEEWLTEYAEAYENKLLINQDSRSFKDISSDALYSAAIGSLVSVVMQGGNIANLSAKDAGEIAADDTTAKVANNAQYTVQTVPNNVQNAPQNVQKPIDNQTDVATPIVPNVNTIAPNLQMATPQQAVQAPTIAPNLQRVVSPVAEENATQANVTADVKNNAVNAETHIDNRTMESVGERKTKSFQYDHPELHQYFEYAADLLSMEVENQIANDFMRPAAKKGSATEARVGSRYKARGAVKTLMDAGLTKPQILQSLQDIKNDRGSENYAAAKRVELVLDDMMTNGYRAYTGDVVPVVVEYVKAKQAIEGAKTGEQRQAEYDEAVDFIEGTPSKSLFPSGSLGAKITNGMPQGTGAASKGFVPQTPYTAWSENTQSGRFHDVGEKSVRSVDLPKVNPQGQKTMKTAATVMESKNTTDARVEQIQSAMVDGKMAYISVENNGLAQKANSKIESKGWHTSLIDWTSEVRKGKVSPGLVAEGATLLNNAGNAAECTKEAYINLLTDYANLVHASGQSLQAARILKTLTPESRLYAMQRSVQSMVDEYNATHKGQVEIKMDADLAEKYRKATTDEERDAIVSEIQQNIADQMPSTALDKWTALRYVNMLGNFKTQIRNVAGNVTMAGVTKVKSEVAAGLEWLVSKASGGKLERTKSFAVSKELYSAAYADFKNVQKAALGESKYAESDFKSDFERGIDEKRTIFKVNSEWGKTQNSTTLAKGTRAVTDVGTKVLEGYRKITNQAMEVGDVIFSRITYADALAGYLKANGVTAEQVNNGTVDTALMDRARLYAIKEAQEATFRDTNAFSKAVSNFDRNWGKSGKVISKGILPFRKTPANIAVRAEEYSPLGLINTAVKSVQLAKGAENVSGADVINSLSKTITGSGILWIGYMLAKAGLLFGEEDDKDQAAFNSLTGRQDYSITLPNGISFTVDWLTPASMPLFVGAALFDLTAEKGLKSSDVESAITSITDPIVKMSMMSGVNDALSNIKYADNNLIQFVLSSAANYLTQGLTNTMLGQIERTSEESRMTTYSDPTSLVPTWMQRIGGKASAKTPGVDYNQGEYVDAWGRTQGNGTMASKLGSNFFSPAYTSTVNETALDKELQRLYDATGDGSVIPKRVTDTSISLMDGKYSMTIGEQVKFQKTRGQYAYKELDKLTNSAEYKAMSDEDKAKAVSDVYSDANYNARQTIVEAGGKLYIPNKTTAEKLQKYQSVGYTQKQAYNIYKTVEALDIGSNPSQLEVAQALEKTNLSNKDKGVVWEIQNGEPSEKNPYTGTLSAHVSPEKTIAIMEAYNTIGKTIDDNYVKQEGMPGAAQVKAAYLNQWLANQGYTSGQIGEITDVFTTWQMIPIDKPSSKANAFVSANPMPK